ncbi:hypothetical protein [Gymnodinialimonas sp. 57CJ19]|uniref:hypothetical protein n=1 Tax=Gymnodinialimonas sp. 57CJ19 TaxID=3138498 RepID=UPI003134506A
MRAGVTTAMAAAFCVAAPALAALEDLTPEAYRGICVMTQTCTDTGACGTTPALGELLVVISESATHMGRNEGDLRQIDRFGALEDALPLPRTSDFRREFLVDLAPDGRHRRFAVHVQTTDPQTDAPALRPQYFVLSCEGQ